MKEILIAIEILLIIIIARKITFGILYNTTIKRATKLFHYFDTAFLSLDNYNKNGLYSGILFTKYIDKSAVLGYNIDFLDTIAIGNYIVLDDEEHSTTIDKLFIIPMLKYERFVDITGPDYTIDQLIKDGNLSLRFNKDTHEIEVYIGEYNCTEIKSIIQFNKIKHMVTKFYNVAKMKKNYLGLLMILPSVLDDINRELESFREKMQNAFGVRDE